jgi:hypothetical protein
MLPAHDDPALVPELVDRAGAYKPDRRCHDRALDDQDIRIRELEGAARSLEALGFIVTPPSAQTTHAPDGALVPAGTAFRNAMLEEGFIDVIAPVADTSRTRRMGERMAQHAGVHLACFGTAAANEERARRARQGFDPLRLIEHSREVDVNGKASVARYRVVHVRHDTMPEGRVEYVEHLTPELLWQPRWLAHANGVTGLAALFVVAEDVAAASARWARFSGLSPLASGPFLRLQAARGEVLIGRGTDWEAVLGASPPAPALAGYMLACGDPAVLGAQGARLRGARALARPVDEPPSGSAWRSVAVRYARGG